MTETIQKVALVTGAARGIGLAVAKRFLADGWRVALLDIERELLHGAVAALASPGHTLVLDCDVSDADAVASAMETLSERFGRLDALVNNAGVAGVRADPGNLRSGLEPRARRQPHRAVPVHQGGRAFAARAWRRRHRQHHLDFGGQGLDAALGLRHQQGRPRPPHQATRRRTGLARHPRQRRGAGAGRDRDGPGGPHPGNPVPIITTPSRSTVTGWRRNWRKPCSSCGSDRASYITGQILAVDGGFDAAGIGLPTPARPAAERLAHPAIDRPRYLIEEVECERLSAE